MSENRRLSIGIFVICLSWVVITRCLLWLNIVGWPGVHCDGGYFARAAISLAKEDSWKILHELKNENGYGGEIGFFHGVMSPYFFGRILRCDSADKLVVAFGWVNSITYCVWSMGLYLLGCARGLRRVFESVGYGLLMCHVALQTQGRPEQFAPLLSLPAVAVWLSGLRGRWFILTAAVSNGLLFATSPMLGISGGMLFILACGSGSVASMRSLQLLAKVGFSAVVSIVIASVIISSIWPEGPVAWFREFVTRGGDSPDQTHLLFFWKASYRVTLLGYDLVFPFWNISWFVVLLSAVSELVRHRNWLLAIVFCSLWYLQLRIIADYGVIPMVAVFAVVLTCRECDTPSVVALKYEIL